MGVVSRQDGQTTIYRDMMEESQHRYLIATLFFRYFSLKMEMCLITWATRHLPFVILNFSLPHTHI
jgi:hypothetical protein